MLPVIITGINPSEKDGLKLFALSLDSTIPVQPESFLMETTQKARTGEKKIRKLDGFRR
jgi:hypothetical protein